MMNDVETMSSTSSTLGGGIRPTKFTTVENPSEIIEIYRSKCKDLQVKPISSFVKLLQQSPLAEVILDNAYFGERGLTPVVACLQFTKMTVLSMSNCSLTHEHLAEMRRELAGHPYLTQLKLSNNEFGPQAAKRLLDIIASTPQLTEVVVDATTPKYQYIRQLCLANSNIHIAVTCCIYCKRQVLGQSMVDVEYFLLQEMAKSTRLQDASDKAIVQQWKEIYTCLKENNYIFSICCVECMHAWLDKTTSSSCCEFPSSPNIEELVLPPPEEQLPRCSYCGTPTDMIEGCVFKKTPHAYLLSILPTELSYLVKSQQSSDVPVFSKSAFAKLVKMIVEASGIEFGLRLCSSRCGKSFIRQGFYGGGGLLPAEYDPRDLSLHEHFGPGRIPPNVNFLVCDQPTVIDIGEQDLSVPAAAILALSQQEDSPCDLLYTLAAARHCRSNDTSIGFGCDLRSVCLSIIRHGVLPLDMTPFSVSQCRSKWASWTSYSSTTSFNLHRAAASRRKGAYFSLDPPPPGRDLFDSIRAVCWSMHAAKRAVIAGCKWRPLWLQQGAIIGPSRCKGGLLHAIRILGQKIINDIIYLVVAPSFGQNVGDRGLFYFPREIINRELHYGCYVFKDSGHVIDDSSDRLLSTASDSTRNIVSNSADVECILDMLALSSHRKCAILRQFMLPVVLEAPKEASYLIRSTNTLPTQHDVEKLHAVRRLYRSGCKAQIVFFWECQIPKPVSDWIAKLLVAYNLWRQEKGQRHKANTVKIIDVKRRSSTLGSTVKINTHTTDIPIGEKKTRRESMLHLSKADRESAIKEDKKRDEEMARDIKSWDDRQQRASLAATDQAVKAQTRFFENTKASSRDPLSESSRRPFAAARLSISKLSDINHAILPNINILAAAVRVKSQRAFLHHLKPGSLDLSSQTIFFWADTAGTLDLSAKKITIKIQPTRTHPALTSFPFLGGIDAVVYEKAYSSSVAYVFTGPIWAEYHLCNKRVHSGPYHIGDHPKFRNLPEDFHVGITTAISVPGSTVSFIIKGSDVIEYDVSNSTVISRSVVGVTGPFAKLPSEMVVSGIDSCAYRDSNLVFLLSEAWCVTWDFVSEDFDGVHLLTDSLSVFHVLPAHISGNVGVLMKQLSKHLFEFAPFDTSKCSSYDKAKQTYSTKVVGPATQRETECELSRLTDVEVIPSEGLISLVESSRSVLHNDHTFVPYDAKNLLGVFEVEKSSDRHTLSFLFKSPQNFGYLQVAAIFKKGSIIHVEASVNGSTWRHLSSFRHRICCADTWWGEHIQCKAWRITLENCEVGDVIHRVHWYSVSGSTRNSKFSFLETYSLKSEAEVTTTAPLVLNLRSLCPSTQTSPYTGLVSWESSSTCGWLPKHCAIPLLGKNNNPSDVVLLFVGTRFVAWSHSRLQPLQQSASDVRLHNRFSGLPPPFSDIGFDAALYSSPQSDPHKLYLFCEDNYILWDLDKGCAIGSVCSLSHPESTDAFKSLPPQFTEGIDTATNIFGSETNEIILFKDGNVLHWSLAKNEPVRAVKKLGTPSNENYRDSFSKLPAHFASDSVFVVARLPSADGYLVFSGSEWLHYSSVGVVEGPHSMNAHKHFIKLPSVLGWMILEKGSWILTDLKNSPQLFVGCRAFNSRGSSSNENTFRVQWSDDTQVWHTTGKLKVGESGVATWVLSTVRTSHRFWRILLCPFKVQSSITRVEWLKLPMQNVHSLPQTIKLSHHQDVDIVDESIGSDMDLELLFSSNKNNSSKGVPFRQNETLSFDSAVCGVGEITITTSSSTEYPCKESTWLLSASKDGVSWKPLIQINVVDCHGHACWSPFGSFKFWKLTLSKCHDSQCILQSIRRQSYRGPIATVAGELSQQSLLLLDSNKEDYVVELDSGDSCLQYDFGSNAQAFAKVVLVTTHNRVLKGTWTIESSYDGSTWNTLSKASPSGVAAKISIPIRLPASFWRIRTSSRTNVNHVAWYSPHTSTGCLSELCFDERLSSAYQICRVVPEGCSDRDVYPFSYFSPKINPVQLSQRSIFSLSPILDSNNPATSAVALSVGEGLVCATTPGRSQAFCGIFIQTTRDAHHNSRCEFSIYVSANPHTSDGKELKWYLVATHLHINDLSRCDWVFLGSYPIWKLVLNSVTVTTDNEEPPQQIFLQHINWIKSTHQMSTIVRPSSVSSEGIEPNGLQVSSFRNELCLPEIAVQVRHGSVVFFNFERPQHLSHVILRYGGDVTGQAYLYQRQSKEHNFEQVSQAGSNFISVVQPSPEMKYWKLVFTMKKGISASLTGISAVANAPSRWIPQVDLRPSRNAEFDWDLGVLLQPSATGCLSESQTDGTFSEIKDFSRRIGKYIKEKKSSIRVTGLELSPLSQVLPAGNPFEWYVETEVIENLYLRDFKLVKSNEPPADTKELGRLEYRGTIASEYVGLNGNCSITLKWSSSLISYITTELSDGWLPIGTFPHAPGLLYVVPPILEKNIVVLTSSDFIVSKSSPLHSPSQSFTIGINCQTPLILRRGVNIIGEINIPVVGSASVSDSGIMHLLSLLLPEEPCLGVYHCDDYSSSVMTLSVKVGPMCLESITATTSDVTLVLAGGESIQNLFLQTEICWGGMKFLACGESSIEDDGLLRLTGDLISGEWIEPLGIAGTKLLNMSLEVFFSTPDSSPSSLSVNEAHISGTLYFDSALACRCKIDISSSDLAIVAYSPLVPISLVPQFALLSIGGDVPDWIPKDIALEDAILTLSENSHSVTGTIKIFGKCGKGIVQRSPSSDSIIIKATIHHLVIGILSLEKVEGSSGIDVSIVLGPPSTVNISFSACISIVGIDKVKTNIVMSDSGTSFKVEGRIGGEDALMSSFEAVSVGPLSDPDDFLITGKFNKKRIEKVLHESLLQVPLIQGIVGAGLRFKLRLDGLELQSFLLSRPTMCVRFVGVIMGADYDLFGVLDPETPHDFLPSVSSKLVEQCWGPLLRLYQDFSSQVDDVLVNDVINNPVLSFIPERDTDGTVVVSEDDW